MNSGTLQCCAYRSLNFAGISCVIELCIAKFYDAVVFFFIGAIDRRFNSFAKSTVNPQGQNAIFKRFTTTIRFGSNALKMLGVIMYILYAICHNCLLFFPEFGINRGIINVV